MRLELSERTAWMTLPRVQPIAPTSHKEPFDDSDWLFDMKYDGYRALCYLEQRRNRLISRNYNTMTRFEALAGQVAAALDEVHDAILDGEIIAADETGRPQFYDLLRGTRAPAYVAFDIVWLNVSIFGIYRYTSVGSYCGPSCRRDRRSFPSRFSSRAGDASFSN
jgi:ATP-dependent DNA ligase